MIGTFQYSVLKYRHSFLLNEVVNVGLLLYFPEEGMIRFIYPYRLNRISGLYSNFDIGTIKTVQGIFDNKCLELNSSWMPARGSLVEILDPVKFEDLILNHFLVEDASSLYFDDIKSGVNIGIEKILSHYYDEYFSCYHDAHIVTVAKKDEKYIEHKIKSELRSKFHNRDNKINLEINKDISSGLVSERFKLGWKNGTENLIVPVAFDLVESDTIKQKSLSWFGKLSFLGEYAKSHNISFHIFTSKPVDKGLFRSYDNAIRIIEKADAPKELFEDREIESYANRVVKHISANEGNESSQSQERQ